MRPYTRRNIMQTTKVEIHYKLLLLINTHIALLLLSNRQRPLLQTNINRRSKCQTVQ